LHPELRLAFSRPGFVTWKASGLAADFAVRSPIAHVAGWGSGHARDIAEVQAKVASLVATAGKPCLHVFGLGDDDVKVAVVGQSISELQARLEVKGVDVPLNVRARPGQCVIDVIVLDQQQWFVGWHVQDAAKSRVPGGVRPVSVDEASPSRAYSKVAELLSLAELNVQPGNTVVELGAAPGGSTLYLLQQGARVWAIDPAPLATQVVELGRSKSNALTLLEVPAAELTRQQLPKQVDYLVSDVNLAPTVSLRYLERLSALIHGPKRGILVNIKINDEKAEALLLSVLDRARALGQRIGLPQMRVAQLPSHRREIGVVLRRAQTK
jgi:23S rRNA (cytidine2498-2'-O)-methyltransferase